MNERLFCVLALALVACSGDGASADDGPANDESADAAAPDDADAGFAPSQYTSDSGYDAGRSDAAKPDAGLPSDAGGLDAAPPPPSSGDAGGGGGDAGGGPTQGCCIVDEPYACPSSITCPDDLDTCIQKCMADPQCIDMCLNATPPAGCTPDPSNLQACGF